MRISLLTVPVDPDPKDFEHEANSETETLARESRAEGQLPVMPKIAIVSIIHWMEQHGYSKDMYDYYDVDMLLPTDAELEHYFTEYNPTVIGLSAVVSTCYSQVRRMSRIARSVCPDAWIVLGGSLTASANPVLRLTDVDMCIVGDGEIPWVEFLDYVAEHGRDVNYEELANILALAYLDTQDELHFTGYGKAIPGESNPYPDYDILLEGLRNKPAEFNNYFRHWAGCTHFKTDPRSWEPHRRPNIASLWTTKGCVARCTFCQRSTKGYRVSDTQKLSEHLAVLNERFDVGFIHILDENFGSDREQAYEVARVMKRHDMMWMASGVRCASVANKEIQFYKEHNCVSLKFGIESGSQKMLDVMEKNFTIERLMESLKACVDHDVYSPLAVMVGMPGETNETVLQTGKFLGRICHLQNMKPSYNGLGAFYALPLPGTPLYIYGQQVGVIGKSAEEEEKFLLAVSGEGASKRNYVNLNAAKKKDVVFWDWLVTLEASRTYMELERQFPHTKTSFMNEKLIQDKHAERVGTPISFWRVVKGLRAAGWRGLKIKVFYAIDMFLRKLISVHDSVHRLPRWLVYGVARNMVYLQYLLQKAVLKVLGRGFNLYEFKGDVEPLADDRIVSRRHNRSLRTVVNENARTMPPQTMTEANQEVLGIGL